ncbi:MAG: DUF2513 domain-containing protein [Clostridiales bacterium]|nr:DUF2513 domain-containing protein [Clostridiales bacterium]
MQLKHDCIRALLLYLEKNLKINTHGLPEGIKVKNIDFDMELPSFSVNDIYYSIQKLVEAEYIYVRKENVSPRVMIIDEISLKGHEFIDASKNNTVWKKAIEFIKQKGGGITLEVLKQLLIQYSKDMFLK